MPEVTGWNAVNEESSAVPGVLEIVEEDWDEIVLSCAVAEAKSESTIAEATTEKRIEIP
jgi:hypothetical protein